MGEPIVTVVQGKLKGKTAVDHRGGQYYSFQGIPYAKAPVGTLRFKAPQPPESWTGVRDATIEGSECVSRHMLFKSIIGSDDCLFLNVYTPQLPDDSKTNEPKPVMVWIHGGGFTSGSSKSELYGPELILPEDVVVVTINYRLGVLGFLSLEDTSLGVPGNAGLKDMVMALKWVQQNIAQFNGNPNNVTIFGESAGGAAVHYLILSPMAKGLFHRGIAQSGCALNYWASGRRCGQEIAKALGKENASDKEILETLEGLPAEQLLEIQEKVPDRFTVSLQRPHGPVVEKPSSEPAFLPENPVELMLSGNYTKVPLMIGFTTREGMLGEVIMKDRHGEFKVIADFEEAIPYFLNIPKNSDMFKKTAQRIKRFYYGDEEPTLENVDRYYVLGSDNHFIREIQRTVNYQISSNSAPIYLYRFSLETTLNFFKIISKIKAPGVCHADDLGYLFKTLITPETFEGSIEDISIRRVTKLWANFARYGNPNPIKSVPFINVQWPPVKEGQLNFLDIGENLTVGVNPEAKRMEFWDEIFKQYPTNCKL